MTVARQRPPGDPLSERAKANFIILMLRSIDARRRQLKNHAKKIEELKTEKAALTTQLENDYYIRPHIDEENSPAAPEVTGRFDAGLTLCTDRFLLDEKDVSSSRVLVTRNTGMKTVRYIRTENAIIEAP